MESALGIWVSPQETVEETDHGHSKKNAKEIERNDLGLEISPTIFRSYIDLETEQSTLHGASGWLLHQKC